MSQIIEIKSEDQFKQLIKNHSKVIVKFSAEWCGPCKRIQIDYLMNLFPANWLKCDIDKNDYTAGYCNIRSIPTFLIIYKKKILGIKSSANTNEISNWLKELIVQ